MSEEQRAQALKEWLERHPGGTPPEDVDPDVVAAVSLLRPDLAPAPRVSLDDILGGVKDGPFAHGGVAAPEQRTPANQGGFPEGRQRSRGRAVWLYPLLGVAFAAAASTLIVLPLAYQSISQRAAPVAYEPAPAAEAPAPPATIPEAAPIEDVTGALGEEVAAPPPPRPPAGPMPEADGLVTYGGAGAGSGAVTANRGAVEGARPQGSAADPAGPAPIQAPPPPDLDAELAKAAADTPRSTATGGDVAPAEESEDSFAASAPASKASSARREGRTADTRTVTSSSESKPAEPAKAPAPKKEKAADQPIAELSAPGGGEAVAAAPPQAASGPAAERAPASSSVARDDGTLTAGSSAASTGTASITPEQQGMSARQRGVPLDYNPAWYRAYADVTASFTAAQALEVTGDLAGAERLYRTWYGDARVSVAQDAAWRGAKALWGAGRGDDALVVLDAALRRGGEGVHRAHLLVLKGDILAASGRQAEAQRAWASAATENARRSAPKAAPP